MPSGGRTPRNFALDPSGEWLLAANQDSDTIVAMRRDSRTGGLSDPEKVFDIPSAVCLVFCE
jgi:6-phosphogluconolactonase